MKKKTQKRAAKPVATKRKPKTAKRKAAARLQAKDPMGGQPSTRALVHAVSGAIKKVAGSRDMHRQDGRVVQKLDIVLPKTLLVAMRVYCAAAEPRTTISDFAEVAISEHLAKVTAKEQAA